MSLVFGLELLAFAVAGTTDAATAKTTHAPAKAKPPFQAECAGVFSNGQTVDPNRPRFLNDLPGTAQTFCDFHTFSWNQFLYLIQLAPDPNNGGQVTPLFLHLAPWYSVLQAAGTPPPPPYPGPDTSLSCAHLSMQQAGDDDHLIDVAGGTVLYDIRFNQPMYNTIAGSPGAPGSGLYTEGLFQHACAADQNGNCTNPLLLPPFKADQSAVPGSLEIKTAWRDFGSAPCPSSFYCNGRFGLVGMHLVQKTVTHGEWIWASFEHVANDPDCDPSGDTPIAPASPLGTPWSFFNPATAAPGVMSARVCSTGAPSPQCNADPRYQVSKKVTLYKPVNVCRMSVLPPGGASTQNCAVPPNPTQPTANNAGNVACLNATFQPRLQNAWKNYKMIGSLWIKGTTAPDLQFRVDGFQDPQPPLKLGEPIGFPHLANTTMETWLQPGSTGYDPKHNNASKAGCFFCHNLPSAYTATSPSDHRSDDLSHFPGKLPAAKLKALLESLVPASSTQKGKN